MTFCAAVSGERRPPVERGAGRLARALAAVAAATVLLAPALPADADRDRMRRLPGELTHPFLSPAHAQWLVGPISWIASEEEIGEYLATADDEEAREFIEAFWERRDPVPKRPDNPLREQFEERSEEADRLFTEATYPGRRTARGTIFVLYGEPDEVEYDIAPVAGGSPVIVWRYDRKETPKGLDGEKPRRNYRFIKRGDLTVFYEPDSPEERRRRLLDRQRPRPPGGWH